MTGPGFVVPENEKTSPSLNKVVLHFKGFDAEIVRVQVFADHFIYGAHPKTGVLEGLMFPTSRRCVFGLVSAAPGSTWFMCLTLSLQNWFHANWVKMCAPKDEQPYVQLAAQEHVPSMVTRHQLPPKETQKPPT